MDNMSLSDIAAVTRDGEFGGGSSAWVLIILFALIFGWGGNGFGNRNGGDFAQYATAASQNEILLGQQFQTLGQAINQVGDGLCSSTYALNNSINGVNQNLGNAITSEGRSLQMQLSECCCDNVKSNAELKSLIIAENGKTRDLIQENKIESLQGQINQLQLQSALCGVVRYPNSMAYNAGTSPFCNGCGC